MHGSRAGRAGDIGFPARKQAKSKSESRRSRIKSNPGRFEEAARDGRGEADGEGGKE
jgi:hypothetical protein